MSEINMFKRKTKVIDDDENMQDEGPQIKTKMINYTNGNQSINKNLEEKKSFSTHSDHLNNNITNKTEKSSNEKKDHFQHIKSTQENFNKIKSSINQETQKKTNDKNNINIGKQSITQNSLDKIKNAIQISNTSDTKKSAHLVKDVRIINLINKFE